MNDSAVRINCILNRGPGKAAEVSEPEFLSKADSADKIKESAKTDEN